MRASIACIEAVRSVDPRARFVFAEPIIHVVPPRNRPDLERAAATQDASQWEWWDMISGKVRPELGGNPKYLDMNMGMGKSSTAEEMYRGGGTAFFVAYVWQPTADEDLTARGANQPAAPPGL